MKNAKNQQKKYKNNEKDTKKKKFCQKFFKPNKTPQLQ